jgi:hypothetical protein
MQRLITILSVLLVAAPALAYRPPLPETEWDESTQLTLAQAMVGEADWHEPDHVAIAFVLARRWRIHQQNRGPLPFARYIELYSASLRSGSSRSEWVRALPWGPLPGPYGTRWDRIQKLVRAWGAGQVKDPCPSAMHWGGAMDRPSRSMSPISCGLTRNIFYTQRERMVAAQSLTSRAD